MRKELKLPSIYERIVLLSTMFCAKTLKNNGPPSSIQIKLRSILNNSDCSLNPPQKAPYSVWLSCCAYNLLKLNVSLNPDNTVHYIPPWKDVQVTLHYTPISVKQMYNTEILRCITLEAIDSHLQNLKPTESYAFTDGSVQLGTGRTGCACAVYKGNEMIMSSTQRLNNWASTTQTELLGIYLATEYLKLNGGGVIFCDSKSALQSLNNPSQCMSEVACNIKWNVIFANDNNYCIKFVWIPSHVGVEKHDFVDRLANEACRKENIDYDFGLSNAIIRNIQIKEINSDLEELRNAQRPESCSIKNYDKFCNNRYLYGQHSNRTRQCDVVIARIRLGYRHIWQVSEAEPLPEYSDCKLCDKPLMHSLEHYIVECETVKDFRPPGLLYHQLCNYFIDSGVLDDILTIYPKFACPF